MSKSNAGIVKSIGVAEDDAGRTVLRAIVDFYDGATPDLTFMTVWSATPVTIVEVRTVEVHERFSEPNNQS